MTDRTPSAEAREATRKAQDEAAKSLEEWCRENPTCSMMERESARWMFIHQHGALALDDFAAKSRVPAGVDVVEATACAAWNSPGTSVASGSQPWEDAPLQAKSRLADIHESRPRRHAAHPLWRHGDLMRLDQLRDYIEETDKHAARADDEYRSGDSIFWSGMSELLKQFERHVHQSAISEMRDRDVADPPEREALRITREALRQLINEILGRWDAFEAGLRQAIGHTNYAVVKQKLGLSKDALARINTLLREGGQ